MNKYNHGQAATEYVIALFVFLVICHFTDVFNIFKMAYDDNYGKFSHTIANMDTIDAAVRKLSDTVSR